MSKLVEELSIDGSIPNDSPDNAIINGKPEGHSYFLLNGKGKDECQGSLPSPQQSPQSSPLKQKPPAVSKKPQISFLPPLCPQPVNKQLPSHKDKTSLSQKEDQVDAPQIQITEEDKDKRKEQEENSKSHEPIAMFHETSTESQIESQTPVSANRESHFDNELCNNGEAQEEDEEEADGTSSTTGSISSKEDDGGESETKFIVLCPSPKLRTVHKL